MSDDFKSARFWARELLESAVFPGAQAIDATMGGGRDTLWLCARTGEMGHVYAFDVQADALTRTRALLAAEGMGARATLCHAGHQDMEKYVTAPVDAVVFNLGWLPGGEKGVTTLVDTTRAAVCAGTRLLKPTGLMTICVYPGHDEGARELSALTDWASSLDPSQFDVMLRRYMNQTNDPPQMIAIRKRV